MGYDKSDPRSILPEPGSNAAGARSGAGSRTRASRSTLTRPFSEPGSSSPSSRERREDETVPDRPGRFHADPLLAGHSMASIPLVSTGRFGEIPLDVPGSEHQVLAGLPLRLEFWLVLGGALGALLAWIQVSTGQIAHCEVNNPLWWFCGF